MRATTIEQQFTHEPDAITQSREKIADWEQQDSLDAPAFSEDLSKQEMIDHLIEYHNCEGFRIAGNAVQKNGTKATKGELLAAHDRMHNVMNDPTTELTYQGRIYRRDNEGKILKNEKNRPLFEYRFNLGNYPFPKIKHRHAAIQLTEAQMSAVAAVRDNKRASETPLSVRDRKVLTELVNNDFGALKQEMRAFASDSLAAKVQEINADWDEREKKIPDFATQATELKRKQTDEWHKLRAEQEAAQRKMKEQQEDAFRKVTEAAEKKGVTLKQETRRILSEDGKNYVNATVYVATVQGRKDALAGVERENKVFLDRALMTLEKQRLTAQRQVLLSGVPQEAMPIVESIPDAKSLMVKAQEESNAKQLN